MQALRIGGIGARRGVPLPASDESAGLDVAAAAGTQARAMALGPYKSKRINKSGPGAAGARPLAGSASRQQSAPAAPIPSSPASSVLAGASSPR